MPPVILVVIPDYDCAKYIKNISNVYNTRAVNSLQEMEKCIYDIKIDLIIIDHALITSTIDESLIRWVCLRKLIPVISLVASNREALSSIEIKANEFVYKPVVPDILINSIDKIFHHIQEVKIATKMNVKIHDQLKEKSKELSELQANIISVLSEIIEFRDFETNSHDIRSQAYVKIMIKNMIEVSNPYQKEICLWDTQDHILSAQLHDIGKIIIPNEILTKPSSLTNGEYEIIKTHVTIGVNIIDKIIKRVGNNSYLSIARRYIESHHEHWNGKGYPYQLSGTDIPLEGRILAIVDAYDVIISERSYKKALPHEEAVKIINQCSGTQFDPELVKIFNHASNKFKSLNITIT